MSFYIRHQDPLLMDIRLLQGTYKYKCQMSSTIYSSEVNVMLISSATIDIRIH